VNGLPTFFDAMQRFLGGEASAASVRRALGVGDDAAEHLEFYRLLVQRNHAKILRELYPPVHALLTREEPGRWQQLVSAYAQPHRASHWNPNRFGREFGSFLQQASGLRAELRELCVELADYCWVRYCSSVAEDTGDDGVDSRLFARHYRYAVDRITVQLEDALEELPATEATSLLIYRHVETQEVRVFRPTPLGLAALARRQGVELPAALADLQSEALDRAEAEMMRVGVLATTRPRRPS